MNEHNCPMSDEPIAKIRQQSAIESSYNNALTVIANQNKVTEALRAELDKAQRERDEWQEHAALTDKEILQLSDWLISNAEFDPKTGLIDHCAKLKERVRDLIAAEGEVGDLQEQLTLAREELAELTTLLRYTAFERLPLGNTTFDTLPFHWQERIHKALATQSTKEAK